MKRPKKDFSIFFQVLATLVCLCITIYLANYKTSVPTFPRPENEYIFDCNQIIVNNLSSLDNKIIINISSYKFYNYPKLTAPYLLRVLTKNGDLEQCFNCKSFFDILRIGNDSTFNIIHSSDGNIGLNIYCQNTSLYNTTLAIKSENPTKVKGYTSFIQNDNDKNLTYHMSNICINRSFLNIFDQTKLDKTQNDIFTYKASTDISIQVKHENDSMDSFNKELTKHLSMLIIQSAPKTASDLIIDALLPLYIYQQKRGAASVYFMDKNNKELIEYSELILNQPRESFLLNDGIKCAHDAYFLYSTGNREITTHHERTKDEQIKAILNDEISYIKFADYFKKKNNDNQNNLNSNKNKMKIVVVSESGIQQFNNSVNSLYEFQTIKPDQSLLEIMQIVSSANVFIPFDDDFIHMLWMIDTNASVITKYSNYSQTFANLLNIKSIDSLNISEKPKKIKKDKKQK